MSQSDKDSKYNSSERSDKNIENRSRNSSNLSGFKRNYFAADNNKFQFRNRNREKLVGRNNNINSKNIFNDNNIRSQLCKILSSNLNKISRSNENSKENTSKCKSNSNEFKIKSTYLNSKISEILIENQRHNKSQAVRKKQRKIRSFFNLDLNSTNSIAMYQK